MQVCHFKICLSLTLIGLKNSAKRKEEKTYNIKAKEKIFFLLISIKFISFQLFIMSAYNRKYALSFLSQQIKLLFYHFIYHKCFGFEYFRHFHKLRKYNTNRWKKNYERNHCTEFFTIAKPFNFSLIFFVLSFPSVAFISISWPFA